MKVSKEKLKQMIKEELENVMKETEQFPTKADKKLRQRGPSPSNQFGDNTDHYTGPEATAADREWAEKNKADIAKRRAEMDAEERKKFKKGMERDAKKTGNRLGEGEEAQLEEIKGPAAAKMADAGVNFKSEIDNVRFGSDEPAEDYDLSDQIPPGSKDEFINGVLERLGIEPSSEEGQDIAAQLKAAAKVQADRSDRRWAKRVAATRGGNLEETEQKMEELRESFRRFTKLPKNTLKD